MADMAGNDDLRCDRCGELVTYDGKSLVCVGCDHRVDGRGRKTRAQPSKAERVKRKLAQPSLFTVEQPRGPIFQPNYLPNFDDPPPSRFTARPKRPKRPRCEPCDRWLVVRRGFVICWACGEIHKRPAA